MSYNYDCKTSDELWAIVDKNNAVCWSRGGSSSYPKLMVYPSEKKAVAALKNSWTKQCWKEGMVSIKKIYSAT